jgi:hypothetical protein
VSVALLCRAHPVSAQRVTGDLVTTVPFRLLDNQVFLDVRVNHSPPISFILNTGGPFTLISRRRAELLGMTLERIGNFKAVGADSLEADLVGDNVSLYVGDAVLSDQRLVATSFDVPAHCFDDLHGPAATPRSGAQPKTIEPMEGVLGRPFFDHFVVEIDHAKR